MKIGIDARFYGTAGRGLGRYVSELIRELELTDRENEYVVFLRRANFDAYEPKNPKFTKALAEFPWYGWKEQLLYPFWLRKFKLDLLHFPHFNVPLLYRRPFVVTVHDLILMQFPTVRATTLPPFLFRLKFAAYKLVIGSALRRAREILTVSQFVKNDIERTFPFAKNKRITVTYEACAPTLAGATRSPADSTPITGPYFLYVGSAYPHKNLEKLISSFAEFRRAGHGDHHLVIVGEKDRFMSRLEEETKASDAAGHVVFLGRATDEELANIYDGALAYVFPSLCEGFGLPPLEAMSRGVPVASSRACCLPEILGDAAEYFDPNDEKSIAASLAKLADDAPLREALREKGRQRVKKFRWKKCAEETLVVYEKALAK